MIARLRDLAVALGLALGLALAVGSGLAGTAQAQPSQGRLMGLLVGASDYPDAALPLRPLRGPRNDVLLMADLLVERGAVAGDVIVLTERPEAADYRPGAWPETRGPATRAAILAAFADLTRRVRPGDEVVILLSGHGWQQEEAVFGSEPDGLDEAFLPIDYGQPVHQADSVQPRLTGALTDDEIGGLIDALRARGANVFLIADFCHAGDSTRGLAEPGVPSPEPRLDPATATGPALGAYAAFFAAPAGSVALSGAAPIWAEVGQRLPHGLLTAYTAAALRDPGLTTFAELAARVQSSLIEHDVRDHAVRLSGPAEFEGDLQRPVLGRAGVQGEGSAWTVAKPALTPVDGRVSLESLTLNAGALHGLSEGALVALVDPTGGRERRVLYGRVTAVEAAVSQVVPADHPEVPIETWRDIRRADGRPYTDRRLWLARLVERGMAFDYRVARPGPGGDPALSLALGQALDRLDGGAIRLVWTEAGAEADLHLHLVGSELRLSEAPEPEAAGAVLGRLDLGRIDDEAALAQALSDGLLRAARAHRLRRLLYDMSQPLPGEAVERRGAGRLAAEALETRLYLWRPPGVGMSDRCPPFNPDHATLSDRPPADAIEFEALGLDADGLVTLRPCDVVFSRVVNRAEVSVDVTMLAFSPDAAIWALPWIGGRDAVRFEPGRARLTAYQVDPADARRVPREELVLIAVEADRTGGAPADFSRLQQPGVAALGGLTPGERLRSGAGGGPLDRLLDAARFDELRSGSAPARPERVIVRRFSLQVAVP